MLTGKTAIVTGGSRGIGRAIALEMAHAGADIAFIYMGNEQAAGETKALIEEIGRHAKAYQCDVSQFAQAKETVSRILSDFGGVDILVNNAGIVRDALVMTMREEQFDAVLDINLKGAFNMIRHISGHLVKRRAGRIINITSVTGIMGNPGQSNYAAAKAGLIGMTKSVARELASRNITCNAIAPGFIETEMTAELSDKASEALLCKIPAGRMGTAQDVASMAAYLASDRAAYITGEVIKIDGGLCM